VRFVTLSWNSEERTAVLHQNEIHREADREWERRHPEPERPVIVAPFPRERTFDDQLLDRKLTMKVKA
jgi:hypothetical protein